MTYRNLALNLIPELPIPILFTIPNFITAGSGRVMVNILERLDPKMFAPCVCVLKAGGGIENELRERGIPLLELPFTVPIKPYASLLPRAKLAGEVFKRYGFRIWHSFHYADDYSEPLIARLSGARAWVYTKKAMSWGSRAWFARSVLAARIVADNSEMPGKFFSSPLLRGKVRVIHHGISTDQFRPVEAPGDTWRTQLGIAQGEKIVACVAHLVPVKGHPTLIEAAAGLPDAHVLLAGSAADADYTAQLKAQAARLDMAGRVHFLGKVEDIPALLQQVDVVVLPTWDRWRKEGCPVALLEAMACAKACVATDIPGARDIIQDGVNGRLVRAEDPLSLRIAIQKLIENPLDRARLGAAARQRILEQFTIEREVAAHQALYLELLRGQVGA